MSEKKFWATFGGVTTAIALGAGYLIYSEFGQIEAARAHVAQLRTDIKTARETVRKTPEVEREVIVLREISDRIREVLPDTKDLLNVIRDFQDYSKEAGVKPSAFRPSNDPGNGRRQQGAFEKVGYQLTMTGDSFQFLEFLDKIETHSRFMAVSSFKVNAASRKALEEDGVANHRIQMEVETYKYVQPSAETTGVEINGYERKRDLLAGEIARRRDALTTLETYRYRGPRGRRDPLIDPRVPAQVDDPNAWTVQRQMEEVDQLVARMAEARRYWEASNSAASVLERMVQRSELEKVITLLDEDIRRIERENRISYKPAEKRLSLGVTEPLAELRLTLAKRKADTGPSVVQMLTVGDLIFDHISAGDYGMALDAFKALEDELELVKGPEERARLADWLRLLADDARTLRDFAAIEMVIGGYALHEGYAPVVIVNGKTRSVGDPVGDELIVHDVRPNEIDFVFRGAILTRVF